MNAEAWISILVGVIGSIMGASISAFIYRKYLAKRTFTKSNAVELLKLNRPEEWNEVRILNPDWTPDLRNKVFDKVAIPTVNLSRADLSGASFQNAILDSANFSEAKLVGTDFSQASLVGARFDFADLREANLSAAALQGASFHKAYLGDNDQIIDSSNIGVDQVRDLRGEQLLTAILHDRDLVYEITPSQFEDVVATAFRLMKYEVEQKKERIDEGYDLLVTRNDPVVGKLKFVIEVKRTKKDFKVGASSLRALYAALLKIRADRAILITTNDLTASARNVAEQMPEMIVIDRSNLFNWLNKAVSGVAN